MIGRNRGSLSQNRSINQVKVSTPSKISRFPKKLNKSKSIIPWIK